MTLPVFPSILPDFPASRKIKAQASNQPLGDGYTYTTSFGLHPMEDSYNFKFDVLNSNVSTISDFLDARSFDGIPFTFQTPEAIADTELQPYVEAWKCRRWTISPNGPARSVIEILLERQWGYAIGLGGSGGGGGSGLFSGTLVFSKIGFHAALYIPNPDSSSNTRPLQLPKAGTALTSVSYRNFIYSLFDGVTGACLCNNSGITGWVPVGQTIDNVFGTGFSPIPEINQQRFDYSFGAATGGYAGFRCDGQTDYYRTWDGNLSLIFGSFYLQGSYDFCGPANAVAAISRVSGSSAVYDGLGPVYDPSIGAEGYSQCNNGRNTLVSDTYNIVFGASGRTGTLQFSAQCFTFSGGIEWNSGGTITIVVNPP